MDFHFNGNVEPRAKHTENIRVKNIDALKLFIASDNASNKNF